jgi:hypothetical protein
MALCRSKHTQNTVAVSVGVYYSSSSKAAAAEVAV